MLSPAKVVILFAKFVEIDPIMKKFLILLAVLLAFGGRARADGGMWLPVLIGERIQDMQAKGLRLSAEDIYSVNQASLKDAVVLFGGGCTGELVSDEGLLFTNHHCGYGYIQRHSSVDHDYLKDGFWAMDRSQELPNPGLSVRFLERMEDVTAAVLKGYKESMGEREREALVRTNAELLEKQAVKDGKGLSASVEALYYGNQYFLFVYKEYRDVRLVGAPPSSIGKFGGETDNWMWPRHTGDFSIFRIYAGTDNEPADYSPSNVPFRPRKSFKISRAGVREGDFTFVYGCPGSTQEYIHSSHVQYIAEVSDPEKIALRDIRLAIMKKYMSQSQAVRIQYSSKYASVANAWKKWQGEAGGIAKMKTVAEKQAYESRFAEWAAGSRYAGLTDRIGQLFAARNPYFRAYEYFNEAVRSVELLAFSASLQRNFARREQVAQAFFKDYYLPIDKEIFARMMEAVDKQLDDQFKPALFKEELARFGGCTEAWAEDLYAKSRLTTPEGVAGFKDVAELQEDPATRLMDAFVALFAEEVIPVIQELEESIGLAYRDYMRGQMAFEPERTFFPDANLTLRVAYGHVEGYSPSDAVYYKPVSTLKGIMQKDNPDIFDYNIPQVLRDIYARGGFEAQPVCFLATNHTTGGNSGSPVLNGSGELIGINFDRVWEGTMSDIVFDPEFCRNISLDVRYLLFVVKEVGHADYLFKEMNFAD